MRFSISFRLRFLFIADVDAANAEEVYDSCCGDDDDDDGDDD